MSENLFLDDTTYPYQSEVENLRALLAAELDANSAANFRIAQLEAELAAHQEREQWIHDNAKTSGGGNGFTVTFFVPVDHEDIFCGISAAIKDQQ